jgi:hypothetical protein
MSVIQLRRSTGTHRCIQVPQEAFVTASKALKKQITPAVLQKFEKWKGSNV